MQKLSFFFLLSWILFSQIWTHAIKHHNHHNHHNHKLHDQKHPQKTTIIVTKDHKGPCGDFDKKISLMQYFKNQVESLRNSNGFKANKYDLPIWAKLKNKVIKRVDRWIDSLLLRSDSIMKSITDEEKEKCNREYKTLQSEEQQIQALIQLN